MGWDTNYRPLQWQKAFHASTAVVKGFEADRGYGKTYGICMEALRLASTSVSTGLLVAPNSFLVGVLICYLKHTLDGYLYKYSSARHTIELTNGSQIRFRWNYDSIRGCHWDWCGVDELGHVHPEVWKYAVGHGRPTFAVWNNFGELWDESPRRQFELPGRELIPCLETVNPYLVA